MKAETHMAWHRAAARWAWRCRRVLHWQLWCAQRCSYWQMPLGRRVGFTSACGSLRSLQSSQLNMSSYSWLQKTCIVVCRQRGEVAAHLLRSLRSGYPVGGDRGSVRHHCRHLLGNGRHPRRGPVLPCSSQGRPFRSRQMLLDERVLQQRCSGRAVIGALHQRLQ